MRIVQLTELEAANSAVMENVARYLLDGDVTHVQQHVRTELQGISDTLQPATARSDAQGWPDTTGKKPLDDKSKLAKEMLDKVAAAPSVAPIGVDAPDVGTEQPEVPLASPFAAIGFGTAAPSLPTAAAGSAPSPQVERRAAVVNAPVAESLQHAGLDLDKNGLYWDERIHSSSKDKNKDGTWRIKRGVDKAIVPAVEAEIRAVLAIPGPGGALKTPTVPAVPDVPPVPAVPLPPAAAATPTPPAAEAEPSGQAFMRWMEDLTPDMQPGGRFTPELMTKLLVAQGLPTEAGLMAFVQRPDLVAAARAMLDVWMADPSQVPQ